MNNNIFINIGVSIGIAYLLAQMQVFCETDVLIKFLQGNLITLLVALIAINSATLSIVLTKIRELIDRNGADKSNFVNTKAQMILSIKEQILLVLISMIILMILDSTLIKAHKDYVIFINTLLIGTFIYELRVLYDTAKSVFVILDF
jgi:hypothetical protein